MRSSLRQPSPHQSPVRQGFVLILVLGLILVTGILAQSIAARSLTAALEAVSAEADLQERWARISIRRALLRDATDLLAAPHADALPRATRDWNFELTGRRYRVWLADESAKANLNLVYSSGGSSAVSAAVRQLAGAGHTRGIRLRPFSRTDDDDERPVFDSWGQVFDLTRAPQAIDEWISATSHITCWGDGRINIRTAPREVLQISLDPDVPDSRIDALLEERDRHPHAELEDLVSALGLSRDQRPSIQNRLTVEPTAYSLWIQSEHDSRRQPPELLILEGDGRRGTVSSFVP